MIEAFPVLGQPTTPPKPGDAALHNPAFWFDDEAFGAITSLDDVDHQTAHGLGDAILKDRPCIGAVGEQLAQERKPPEQRGHQKHASIAVLHVGRRHQRVQHQTQRIDQDMALLPFDQFAGIEPMRIDADPPFSALFTLWLSTMQAVGLASLSACSRHFTYSAWCIFSSVPSQLHWQK